MGKWWGSRGVVGKEMWESRGKWGIGVMRLESNKGKLGRVEEGKRVVVVR